jgi:hypothetical protein
MQEIEGIRKFGVSRGLFRETIVMSGFLSLLRFRLPATWLDWRCGSRDIHGLSKHFLKLDYSTMKENYNLLHKLQEGKRKN